MHAHMVVPHAGVQHAQRAEGARQPRYVNPPAAERAPDGRAMQGPRTSRCDQREMPGIVAALGREPLHGEQQLLLHEPDHSCCGLFGRQAQRSRNAVCNRVAGQRTVDRDRAAGIGTGSQSSEHDLRIGDGRRLAAEAVAGRSRSRACALRADMQQSRIIDARHRSTARTDGMHLG
jgi:hypothetical protein